MFAVLSRFQERLESTGLVPPGATVLVGYSGGADSTCLLHLMAQVGIDVVAGHLHHGQRPEADEEMARCEQFAKVLGVPFVSGRSDVPRLAHDAGIGLEEAGRQARYAFFDSARRSTGCHLVATAHTLDDHVETVLLNLVRGTGLAGIGGIPERRDTIVRPLLSFRRAETRDYCESHGLWFHDDPANTDVSFARARIRHRILPELELVNPEVREAVARLARLAAEEDSLLNGIAAAALESSETKLNGNLGFLTLDCEVGLDKDHLFAHPRPVVSRALRLAAGILGASADYTQTTGLLEALSEVKGSWTFSGGAVVCEWDGPLVHLRQTAPDAPYRFPLTVPGETESLEFGWSLEASPTETVGFRRDRGSLDAVIDPASTKGNLYFRNAEPGDSVQPLGLSGTKKLSDLFQEKGLTLAARRRLPIVCDMVGPVWVPGVCLAERVKITDNSRKGLNLCLRPHASPKDRG